MKWRDIKIGFGCLGIFLLVTCASFYPGYYMAKVRARRTECFQTLGILSKTMKMYANDNNKGWFPKELNGYIGIVDAKLLKSLGKYTNITNTLKDCKIFFSL